MYIFLVFTGIKSYLLALSYSIGSTIAVTFLYFLISKPSDSGSSPSHGSTTDEESKPGQDRKSAAEKGRPGTNNEKTNFYCNYHDDYCNHNLMTNVVLIKLRIKRTLCVWHSSRGFRMEGANEDTGLWVLAQGVK